MNARKEVQEYPKRVIERVIMDKIKDDNDGDKTFLF